MQHLPIFIFVTFVVTQAEGLAQHVTPFKRTSPGKINKYSDYYYGCYCRDIYEPICANDLYTYPNACILNCARKYRPSLLGLCEGECPCCKPQYTNEPLYPNNQNVWEMPYGQQLGSTAASPQQSSNAPSGLFMLVPYGNQQGVTANKTEGLVQPVQHQNENENKYKRDADIKQGWHFNDHISSDRCLCTDIYMPVCGSNNVTYSNLCRFRCASKKEKCLSLTCEGECPCCSCGKSVIHNKT